MPKPKTPAERVSDSEAKKMEKGLKKMWLWAYPESVSKIRKYAKILELELDERYASER